MSELPIDAYLEGSPFCEGEVCAGCGKCEKCGKMTQPIHLQGVCACPNPEKSHKFCPACRARLIANALNPGAPQPKLWEKP